MTLSSRAARLAEDGGSGCLVVDGGFDLTDGVGLAQVAPRGQALTIAVVQAAQQTREDDRAAAVLLWWEAAGEEICRLLALGPGQAQVVAGLGADAPDQQSHDDDEAEPDRDHHDRAVGARPTKPVQDTGHAGNLSPDPDQRTLKVQGTRASNHCFVMAVNLPGCRVRDEPADGSRQYGRLRR